MVDYTAIQPRFVILNAKYLENVLFNKIIFRMKNQFLIDQPADEFQHTDHHHHHQDVFTALAPLTLSLSLLFSPSLSLCSLSLSLCSLSLPLPPFCFICSSRPSLFLSPLDSTSSQQRIMITNSYQSANISVSLSSSP